MPKLPLNHQIATKTSFIQVATSNIAENNEKSYPLTNAEDFGGYWTISRGTGGTTVSSTAVPFTGTAGGSLVSGSTQPMTLNYVPTDGVIPTQEMERLQDARNMELAIVLDKTAKKP